MNVTTMLGFRQAPLQHQSVEDLHRVLQHDADLRSHRRQDNLHARRPQPRLQQSVKTAEHKPPHRNPRVRPAERPPLVRPRQRDAGLGRQLTRYRLLIRSGRRHQFC
jgi:hypothetical protein